MEANPKLEDLQNFFSENFNFRYNVLTDMPECKPKNTATYQMIDNVTFEQIKRAAEYLPQLFPYIRLVSYFAITR